MKSQPDYLKWLLVAAVLFLLFRGQPDSRPGPGPDPVPIDRTAIEAGQRFGCDLLAGYSSGFASVADSLEAGEIPSDKMLLEATNLMAHDAIVAAAKDAGAMIRSRLPQGEMDARKQREVAATMRGLSQGISNAKECRGNPTETTGQ